MGTSYRSVQRCRHLWYQDVRLVFAPEAAIASAPIPTISNFPRYDLDVTYLLPIRHADGRAGPVPRTFAEIDPAPRTTVPGDELDP
jgi:hypothetical protein